MTRLRVCRECHAPATYGEIESRPAVVINRAGTVKRFTQSVTVYWCDLHTGISHLDR